MKRRSVFLGALATSATTYYTVPANTRSKLILLHVAPTSGTTTIPNLSIKVGNTTIPVVTAQSLTVGNSATYFSSTEYVMLEAGTLVVAHSNNSACSLIITVEEETSVASTF